MTNEDFETAIEKMDAEEQFKLLEIMMTDTDESRTMGYSVTQNRKTCVRLCVTGIKWGENGYN